ncbi:MAG TPA: rhamnulokinase family protein [Conexibacter sp.]
MTDVARYIAVDLGAESGRVQLGTVAGGHVRLEEVHRFVNGPVQLPNGLHWDMLGIHREVLIGIAAAARRAEGPIDGIAVDAWGCDYALLDRDGDMLGNPFHYRDHRTDGVMERVLSELPAEEVYAATGIQFMPFNTIFQLVAQKGSAQLEAARALATIPDLLAYWLGGRLAGERTAASTTQLLDVHTGEWARELAVRAGIPAAILPPLVDAGTVLAPLRVEIARDAGLSHVPDVIAVGGHDTASAVVSVPARGKDFAYLSSGTWSLLGMELDAPVTTDEARSYNLTNEGGVDGTVRLLRNVMGLWLVQECRRQWAREGVDYDYDRLTRMAQATPLGGPLIDPDAPELLHPGDMPARIAALCERTGQQAPDGPGATIRCALESLACKYRLVLERIERVAGRRAEVVHVVGGGARNATLCQLAADVLARPVHAGPIEATALGNVMTQALAQGKVGSLEEIRRVVGASFSPDVYEPSADRAAYEQLYQRFLSVTSLASPVTAADFAPTQGTNS